MDIVSIVGLVAIPMSMVIVVCIVTSIYEKKLDKNKDIEEEYKKTLKEVKECRRS